MVSNDKTLCGGRAHKRVRKAKKWWLAENDQNFYEKAALLVLIQKLRCLGDETLKLKIETIPSNENHSRFTIVTTLKRSGRTFVVASKSYSNCVRVWTPTKQKMLKKL